MSESNFPDYLQAQENHRTCPEHYAWYSTTVTECPRCTGRVQRDRRESTFTPLGKAAVGYQLTPNGGLK